jgi:hypothetical protein
MQRGTWPYPMYTLWDAVQTARDVGCIQRSAAAYVAAQQPVSRSRRLCTWVTGMPAFCKSDAAYGSGRYFSS